jgi:hypothetical protein
MFDTIKNEFDIDELRELIPLSREAAERGYEYDSGNDPIHGPRIKEIYAAVQKRFDTKKVAANE